MMIYTNIFEYDIKSAHPIILTKLNYPFKDDWYKLEDKLDRNIYIGKLFRDDLPLRIKVNSYVESIIFDFMYETNNIKNVIMVLYDALFCKQYIEEDIIKFYQQKNGILIRLKNKFDLFIIINKRARKFVGFNKVKCVLKGFTRTKGIENFLHRNLYQEILNGKPLGLILETLQGNFINSNDINLFILEKNDKEFIVTNNKEVEYQNQNIYEIDKLYYLNNIIKPIIDSIVIYTFQSQFNSLFLKEGKYEKKNIN
jgi:hypothetical protein